MLNRLRSLVSHALPSRMLTPADESRFRTGFDADARTYRFELWIVLTVAIVLFVVVNDTYLDARHSRTSPTALVIAALAVPSVLGWASGRSELARRWSTPLYVASVYLYIAVLLTIRVQTTDEDHETIPLLAVIAVLLSLLLVQIRFELLVPLLAAGYAGVVATEVAVSPLTPSRQIELFATGVVAFIPLATVYAHERTLRRTWLAERRLHRAARTDSLTGLPNRRALDEHLAAVPPNGTIAIAVFDVDNFKQYNDDFGHPAGDRCLAAVGEVFGSCGPSAFAARMAGEEFVVIWHDVDAEDVTARATRLKSNVGAIAPVSPADRPVTVSAGLLLPSPTVTAVNGFRALLQYADEALYAAKKSGRDRLVARPAPDTPRTPAAPPTHAAEPDPAGDLVMSWRSLRFRGATEESDYRRDHDERTRHVRGLVMAGFGVVVAILFLGQFTSVLSTDDSKVLSRIVLGGMMLPAAMLGVVSTVVRRLRPYSSTLYVVAVGITLTAQMIQRSVQLPQGIDMVPMLWPVAMLLSMTVVQIRYDVLLPVTTGYLAALIAVDLAVLPLTTSRLVTYGTSILMAGTSVRLAYRIETSTRQGWMSARRLARLGDTDTLTGLPNRRAFDATLNSWRRQTEILALVLVDVDRFKAFNDMFGHLAGDDRLRDVGTRLASFAGPDVFVARIGGEEFAILIRGATRSDVEYAAIRVRPHLTTPAPPGAAPAAALTVSAGLAFAGTAGDLVTRADAQLYRAKAAGRDCLAVEGRRDVVTGQATVPR